jgi:ribosomal protein L30E
VSAMTEEKKGVVLSEEQLKRRRRRSIAIALVLAGLAAIFYASTIVKLGPAAFKRSDVPAITVLA